MTIEQYTHAVYSALFKDLSDVPDMGTRFVDGKHVYQQVGTRRPYINEVEVYSFPQTWGSTALGFGGIGGQAMTTALTVVVISGVQACVYFGGTFAYRIDEINEAFSSDLRRFSLKEEFKAHGAYKRNPQK